MSRCLEAFEAAAAAAAAAAGDVDSDGAAAPVGWPGGAGGNSSGGSRSAGSLSTTDLERGSAVVRSAMDYAIRPGDAEGRVEERGLREIVRRPAVVRRRRRASTVRTGGQLLD